MHPTLSSLKTRFVDPLQRLLSVHPKRVVPVFSAVVGYRFETEITQHGRDFDPSDDLVVTRRWWGARVSFGGDATRSLYYNGALFVRFNFPFGIFVGIRWSGKDTSRKEFLHLGFGHKLNGDFAATFRIQSDDSAAGGTYGPNVGQAKGWEGGTK
jgi:hypothetical protein